MAVISSTLRREGWIGSGTVTDGNKFQVQHLVESNDINDGPFTIALGAEVTGPNPIPMPWSRYSMLNDWDNRVAMKERDTRLHSYTDTGALWIVTTKWEQPKGEDQGSGIHPLARPTRYRVEWANYTKIVKKEAAGQMRDIVNAVGDPFADPVEQDDQRPVLVAVKNIENLVYVVNLGMRYKNAINKNSFWGAKPLHAKVQSITAGDLQEEEDVQYYTMTIRVEFNEEEWTRTMIDRGMRYRKVAGGAIVAAKDGEGTPLGEPVLLNPNGTKRADDEDGLWIDPPFHTYPELNFDALGI